jgi:flagellar basal-body rod protein FlgB
VAAFAGVDPTRLLVDSMRVCRMNHTILANNIANVDTPNFNPTQLDFQATLRGMLEGRGSVSLRKTLPGHIEQTASRTHSGRLSLVAKNDHNKVDIDDQMAQLDQNTGRYSTYGSLLVKRFGQVKDMLSGLR